LNTQCLQGSGEVTSTHYLLSEGVHAVAEIPATDTVLLWLGVSPLESECGLSMAVE